MKDTARAVKASNEPAFGSMGERLEASLAALEETGAWLARQLQENKLAALSGATPFGRLAGFAVGGALLAKGALAAARAGDGTDAGARALEARHFAENLMSETDGLKHAVTRAHETVMQADRLLGVA
jgi:hypothetical protein